MNNETNWAQVSKTAKHIIDRVPLCFDVTKKLELLQLDSPRWCSHKEIALLVSEVNSVLESFSTLTRCTDYTDNITTKCYGVTSIRILKCLAARVIDSLCGVRSTSGFNELGICDGGYDVLAADIDDVWEAPELRSAHEKNRGMRVYLHDSIVKSIKGNIVCIKKDSKLRHEGGIILGIVKREVPNLHTRCQ